MILTENNKEFLNKINKSTNIEEFFNSMDEWFKSVSSCDINSVLTEVSPEESAELEEIYQSNRKAKRSELFKVDED